MANRASFENLNKWLQEAAAYGAKSPAFVVCGNKIDGGKRSVSEAEANKWCAANQMPYFETSAKDGTNIKEMFETLFQKVAAAGR